MAAREMADEVVRWGRPFVSGKSTSGLGQKVEQLFRRRRSFSCAQNIITRRPRKISEAEGENGRVNVPVVCPTLAQRSASSGLTWRCAGLSTARIGGFARR